MALPEAPFQVLVIQAYTPREKSDLAFRKDELLTVLEVDARGQRFRATRDPKAKKPATGWLPMYYVRVVDMMSDKEKKAVAVAAASPTVPTKGADGAARKEHVSVAELVERGDAKKLVKALRKGRSLEEVNSAGKTALQIAAEKGDAETASLLIKAGAAVNTADGRGWTPLHFAALNTRTDVCEVLLRANADPNAQTAESGTTALHLLVRANWSKEVERALTLLVQRGANLELKNKYGETALHQAVSRLNSEGISFLIKNSADLNARNEFGETSLHKAARIGKPAKEVLRQLLAAGCDASIEGRNGTAADLIDFDTHPELRELFPEEDDGSSSSSSSASGPPDNDDSPAATPAVEPPSRAAWVAVSAQSAHAGEKSPRPGGTLTGSMRLGPPPARSAPTRAPAPTPPPSSEAPDTPPLPSAASMSPAVQHHPHMPPSSGSSPAILQHSPSASSVLAERSPPPGQLQRKQTAKISLIQNAYLQQVEAHQKVDAATLMHQAAVAKRRGVSPQRERGEPSFFQQSRAPRDFAPSPVPPVSSLTVRPTASSSTASGRNNMPSSPPPPTPSYATIREPPPSFDPPLPPPVAEAPPPPSFSSSPPQAPSSIPSSPPPSSVVAAPQPPPKETANNNNNNNHHSASKEPPPPLSIPPPDPSHSSPPLSPKSSDSNNSSRLAVPSPLMAVAAQRRMSRKQRGSRLLKGDASLAVAGDLERLSDAEKVAETASAMEERAFVWRATQSLDVNEIREQMSKFASEEKAKAVKAPPQVSPPPAASAPPAAAAASSSTSSSRINGAPQTPEGVFSSLPPLIADTHGFWIETGTANANPDWNVNMSDFTDFYRMYFYGRRQCNFVGYLPVMKANTSNPTIVSVLEEAEPDKLEKLSHRGLIRTKSGVDHFYVNAEAFAKATASVKGKFIDKMGKYLADTYFPGSQLWAVRDREQVAAIESELVLFEEKDPERVPLFAFALVYAQEGDKTAIDMMNHEHSSKGFDEFIDWLGDRIELRGWSGFKGGLDVRGDAKGTHSIYTKYLNKFEIMFHVSTLLPYHELDPLKLVRTRQVQNDVLMLIYIEGENATYDPLIMPTNVTHCFVIVNPVRVNNETMYRVSVVSRSVVPHFTPELPYPPIFKKDERFRQFLLNKLLNGQMAARKSGLHLMYTRPRQAMIRDIINKYIPEKDRQNTQLG